MNLDKTGTGDKRVSGLAIQGTRGRPLLLATVHKIFALALSCVQEFVFRDIQGIRKVVQYLNAMYGFNPQSSVYFIQFACCLINVVS